MYPTMEVRWFYRGQIPPEVMAWFTQVGPLPAEQPDRVDHYLHLLDNDSLGIKLREGRLEIKRRESEPREIDFRPRVSGLVARWRKWSFPLVESDPGLAGPDRAWIAVEKRRRLRRFQITTEKTIETMLEEIESAEGCELELSRVEAADQQWWSVCFEAFGDESSLENHIRLTAQHVFGLVEPGRLEIKDSYSYPAWLHQLG
jgi:hypothetical protein